MTHSEAITAMKNLPALPEADRMTVKVTYAKADPKKVALTYVCKVLKMARTA